MRDQMKRATARRFRHTRIERLEARTVFSANLPDVQAYTDLALAPEPQEGSQVSLTDPVTEWGLNADITDVEGGKFNLAWDLNGNGTFGEPGEPTLSGKILDPGVTFTWKESISWQAMIDLGIAQTTGGATDHTAFVRATQVEVVDPDVASDDLLLTVRNSMPFFGTVTPTQNGGGGGGCGGGIAPVTLAGTFTEYGLNDSVTLRINWGDSTETLPLGVFNNQAGVAFSVQHTYATTGLKNITWEIWDNEGGSGLLPQSPASKGSTSFNVVGGGPAGPSVCLDAAGVLTVTGSSGNDSAMISQPNGVIRVESSFFPTTEFPAASVQNIVALLGAGNDILAVTANKPVVAVGGDGNDAISSGGSRSILIGGTGSDLLVGGSAQDILVDSATVHDNNAVALLAMLAEWNSAHSFTDRVNNLLNGSGSVQGLNETPGGNYFLTCLGDDLAVDILMGAGSTDWIIRHAGDINMGLSDIVTTL